MKDEVLDPPASPMEAAIAQGEGVSVAELREWRLALLELQGRSGGPPSTRRLYRLLRKGKGVPAGVAFSLADFLKRATAPCPWFWLRRTIPNTRRECSEVRTAQIA